LANKNQAALYGSLRRNTDNQFFVDLMVLLNFRLAVIKDQLVETADDDEYKRLQGRGKEIKDMISNLTRKPVDKQATGAFN
jgi:hypothetical protein